MHFAFCTLHFVTVYHSFCCCLHDTTFVSDFGAVSFPFSMFVFIFLRAALPVRTLAGVLAVRLVGITHKSIFARQALDYSADLVMEVDFARRSLHQSVVTYVKIAQSRFQSKQAVPLINEDKLSQKDTASSARISEGGLRVVLSRSCNLN